MRFNPDAFNLTTEERQAQRSPENMAELTRLAEHFRMLHDARKRITEANKNLPPKKRKII